MKAQLSQPSWNSCGGILSWGVLYTKRLIVAVGLQLTSLHRHSGTVNIDAKNHIKRKLMYRYISLLIVINCNQGCEQSHTILTPSSLQCEINTKHSMILVSGQFQSPSALLLLARLDLGGVNEERSSKKTFEHSPILLN